MSAAVYSARRQRRAALEVSSYERLASLLLALIALAGSLVFCLLVAWFGIRVFVVRPLVADAAALRQVGAGVSDGVAGESMKLDSLTHHDVVGESDVPLPDLQTTLAAIVESFSDSPLWFDELPFADIDREGKPAGAIQDGPGKRAGIGDGPGRPGIPPHQRWEIRFDDGLTIDEYARILDHFQIELGVVRPGQVVLVKHLSQPKPDIYAKVTAGEQRLYMSWRKGKLKEADEELLRRAGVAKGRLVFQFYPLELEQTLLALERDYRGRDPAKIRKTRFAIRRAGEGYEFYVSEQTGL